jgi:putative lysine transport system permease protein
MPTVGTLLYAILLAWFAISFVALLVKLSHWSTYEKTFLKWKVVVKASQVFSYFVWATVALLFVDRPIIGFCSLVNTSIASETNPSDFLSGAVYMIYTSRTIYLTGIITTIELAVFGTIIAFALALLFVFLRIQAPDRSDNDAIKLLKIIASDITKVYSTIIRGTPMMVQGMIIYFAGYLLLRGTGMNTQQIGAVWSQFIAGLVTISLNSTAYMMEVLRGGIESVDIGQMEAARSLGLSQWQAMRKVVFPQGVKNSIPALSNELVINIKDSSVLSVIGVFDLMFATTSIAGIYYRQMEIYCVTAGTYLILTLIASRLLTLMSRRLGVARPPMLASDSDISVTVGSSSQPLKTASSTTEK